MVGAGTMGNGIAHVFAQHGWDTTLIDVAPGLLERVLATIRANFERQVKKGTVTPAFKKVGDDFKNFVTNGLTALIGEQK